MLMSWGASRRVAAAVLVVAGIGLTSWAVAADPDPEPVPDRDAVLSAEPVTTMRVRPARPHPAAGAPVRVVVPSMGIEVPVVGIDVVDGVLTPPDDPQVLGWWREGARPGAARGGALVTGHTVSVGGGALDDLEQIGLDAVVRVRTVNGVIRYRVTDVEIYRKASLARSAGRVFSQSGQGRLVLITCEDWDGEKYLSNVVVHAEHAPVT